MPRYGGYGSDSQEQYGGTAFDPMTGRLNGGQLVMQVLNQIAALKRQKTEEGWELEDRDWQTKQRGLSEQNATLDIEAKRREAKDYRSPEYIAFVNGIKEKKKRKGELAADIELENVRSANTIKEQGAREKANNAAKKGTSDAIKKQYLAAKKSIEANYTTSLADLEKQFSAQVGALRKPTAKNETAGRTVTPDGSPYLRALQGAHSSRKRMRAELDARKAQELAKLENDYADALSTSELSVDEGETLTDFHVNPKTGERIGWNGKAWVVAK